MLKILFNRDGEDDVCEPLKDVQHVKPITAETAIITDKLEEEDKVQSTVTEELKAVSGFMD